MKVKVQCGVHGAGGCRIKGWHVPSLRESSTARNLHFHPLIFPPHPSPHPSTLTPHLILLPSPLTSSFYPHPSSFHLPILTHHTSSSHPSHLILPPITPHPPILTITPHLPTPHILSSHPSHLILPPITPHPPILTITPHLSTSHLILPPITPHPPILTITPHLPTPHILSSHPSHLILPSSPLPLNPPPPPPPSYFRLWRCESIPSWRKYLTWSSGRFR